MLASAPVPSTPVELVDALLLMPVEQAHALVLASRPGVTYRDVAARLGEDPAVVLRQLTAGLRALRMTTPA
jgi:DNA-directed RNA polymerase specialized sigma24 family protein